MDNTQPTPACYGRILETLATRAASLGHMDPARWEELLAQLIEAELIHGDALPSAEAAHTTRFLP